MKIELDYVKVGDYYLPMTIKPPPDRGLGKYGLLRLRYLKEHHPIVWAELVMESKLYAHLLETEDATNVLLDSMMPGMAKEAGATEELKARDPMRWVESVNIFEALKDFRNNRRDSSEKDTMLSKLYSLLGLSV